MIKNNFISLSKLLLNSDRIAIIPKKPTYEIKRSPKWPTVRKKWLVFHGLCAACGTTKNLEVHHKIPFHIKPDLELDTNNFITLCEYPPRHCHYTFGHFFDWYLFNPDIEADAPVWLAKLENASKGGGE